MVGFPGKPVRARTDGLLAGRTARISGGHSLAVLAGMIFMPLVVGAGFLPSREQVASPPPVELSRSDLRGTLDAFSEPIVAEPARR